MGFRFTSFIVVYKAKKVKSASTGISIKDVPENKNKFFLQKLKKMYQKKKKNPFHQQWPLYPTVNPNKDGVESNMPH